MRFSTSTLNTAVILAAGRGTRLQNTLSDVPKGFLRLGGVPIVEQSIQKLIAHGMTRILIGTGHLSEAYERLAANYREIECVRNETYASTGSLHTLLGLRDHLDRDFMLLESDLIYEQRSLRILLSDAHRDVILASGRTNSGDEVYIEVDAVGNLVNLSKSAASLGRIDGELVGISKLSIETFRLLCQATAGRPKLDYENGLVEVARQQPIFVHRVDDLSWGEIDDEKHLQRAFATVYPEIGRRETDEC